MTFRNTAQQTLPVHEQTSLLVNRYFFCTILFPESFHHLVFRTRVILIVWYIFLTGKDNLQPWLCVNNISEQQLMQNKASLSHGGATTGNHVRGTLWFCEYKIESIKKDLHFWEQQVNLNPPVGLKVLSRSEIKWLDLVLLWYFTSENTVPPSLAHSPPESTPNADNLTTPFTLFRKKMNKRALKQHLEHFCSFQSPCRRDCEVLLTATPSQLRSHRMFLPPGFHIISYKP